MNNNESEVEVITQPTLSPEELVIEINKHISSTTQNIMEIGRLLIDAKKQIPHGEWADWLSTNVKFTIRTANRFIKCFERFSSNWTMSSNLTSSQMFELLALKADDVTTFVTQKSDEGKKFRICLSKLCVMKLNNGKVLTSLCSKITLSLLPIIKTRNNYLKCLL